MHTITRLKASGQVAHQGTSAVSWRSALVTIASMVAQNTASTGEKPSSMKAMIEMSEPKWNQYCFVMRQSSPFATMISLEPPCLRASTSTMIRMAK